MVPGWLSTKHIYMHVLDVVIMFKLDEMIEVLS